MELWVCDYRHIHPYNVGLAYSIAERGEDALPSLTERLRAEKDEVNQEAIIYVIEIMYKRGYVRGREDVVELVRGVVAGMKDKAPKEVAEESLRAIERGDAVQP